MQNRWSLVVAAALILWLSIALIRVENQRYAMQVGICKDTVSSLGGWDYKCLSSVETRTSPFWHLFYALTGQ